jgi:hypothetical protein
MSKYIKNRKQKTKKKEEKYESQFFGKESPKERMSRIANKIDFEPNPNGNFVSVWSQTIAGAGRRGFSDYSVTFDEMPFFYGEK